MNIETIESINKILNDAGLLKSSKAVQDPLEDTRGPMLHVIDFDGSHDLLFADYDHPLDMYNRANNTKPGSLVFCREDSSIAKRTTITADECQGDYTKCWVFYSVYGDIDIMWHTLSIPE